MNLKLQNDRHKNLFVWRKFAVGLVQEVDNDTAEKIKEMKTKGGIKKEKGGEKRAVFEKTKKATRESQNDVPDLFLLASVATKARVGGINSFA
jgi:hypothetical protein